MAERRMFAKSIINSAKFLKMPATSRLLYYDLGMNADDDGVVEAFAVLRLTGAQEDDLRVLVSKGYIKVLNEELVSLIKDWKINNFIRGDRYRPSIYQNLLIQIPDDESLDDGTSLGIPVDIPSDNQMSDKRETQVSIGKVSVDKISKDNKRASVNADFEYLWSLYPKKRGKQAALKAYEAAVKRGTTKEEVEKGIKAYIASINANRTESRYIKHGDTFFRGAHWQDEYDITGVNNNDGIYNQYGGISNSGTDWRSIDEPNII